MSKINEPFELIGHSYQIADTGDYDGYYEITNGKISLFSKDDDAEYLEPVVKALNDCGSDFYLDDSDKCYISFLELEIKELKAKAAMDLQLPVCFLRWANDVNNKFVEYDHDQWADSENDTDERFNSEQLYDYWLKNVYENGK